MLVLNKIAVISLGRETSLSICNQIRKITEDRVTVETYSITDDISKEFKNTLVILTGDLVLRDLAISKLDPNVEYIVARRVINYKFLKELISLPAGTDVLLVNDHEKTCSATINQLKEHGIDHINYESYYPGIKEFKRLKVAVTPGEPQLVPACAEKVIDIGTRQLDVISIVEILNKMDLISTASSNAPEINVSAQITHDMIELLKEFNQVAEHSIELKNMFRTIIDHSSRGIIYLDNKGVITVTNDVMTTIAGNNRKLE